MKKNTTGIRHRNELNYPQKAVIYLFLLLVGVIMFLSLIHI